MTRFITWLLAHRISPLLIAKSKILKLWTQSNSHMLSNNSLMLLYIQLFCVVCRNWLSLRVIIGVPYTLHLLPHHVSFDFHAPPMICIWLISLICICSTMFVCCLFVCSRYENQELRFWTNFQKCGFRPFPISTSMQSKIVECTAQMEGLCVPA